MPAPSPSDSPALRPLPRREPISEQQGGHAAPTMARTVSFRAPIHLVAWRALLWGVAVLRFMVPTSLRGLVRRDSIERRAARLRGILESMGPTFHKVGQQMSVRADVLPYEYCRELGKLLDAAPPMPLKAALAAVERSCGGPLEQTYSALDPAPIGSASVACVYQATRLDGREVAIKVRRPKIGPITVADLKILGLLASLAESLTLVREGTTRNLQRELSSMLLEELDFGHEARNVELFRRSAKRCKVRWLSAPRVHLDVSSDEVLVTDMVKAVPLTEVLAAVDQQDEPALARLATLDIDPRKVARRLMHAWHWQVFHFTVFHADPHPANILVGPDSSLVFIDFGSCGRVSTRARELTRRINVFLDARDPAGGAATAVKMLEPLPPIDVDTFTKELEQLYWSYIRANASRHSQWWEKSSGRLWMRFATLARGWGLPINLDTLRLFRATFLFDTIVIRLHERIDMPKEFRRFVKQEHKRRKKLVNARLNRTFTDPVTGYMNLEHMLRFNDRVSTRLDDMVAAPSANFAMLPGKISQIVGTLASTVGFLAFGLVAAVLAYDMVTEWDLRPDPQMEMLVRVIRHPLALVAFAGIALVVLRRIKHRLARVKL